MAICNLDQLNRIDLRKVWPNEARDFTKWLSVESNLNMLGNAIGIELELVETESSVGSFNVDIYAQESGTGRKVVIENQLEDTNHDHLGKVITYAAGKGAEVVIWVVARARDEHRQAIEWLNQHTDSSFGFFLVEIELWSIGDSLPAPRFNVVEQPNEWTKTIKLSECLSETERTKLSYWTKYREVAQASFEFLKVFNPQKPSKDHWTTLRCGTSSYHIALLVDTQRGCIGIEFFRQGKNTTSVRRISKENFGRRSEKPPPHSCETRSTRSYFFGFERKRTRAAFHNGRIRKRLFPFSSVRL